MSAQNGSIKNRLSKWLCSCLVSKKKETPTVAQPVPRGRARDARPASAHPYQYTERVHTVADRNGGQRRPSNQRQPEEKAKEVILLLNIQSEKTKEQIKFMACQPHGEDKATYRYLCPICFRYFDSMLEFDCCKNYICMHCGDEINETKTIAKPLCCFCRKENPLIIDVDEREVAKKYIDTPAETPVKTSKSSGTRLARVWNTEKFQRHRPEASGIKAGNDYVPSKFAFALHRLTGRRHNTT